MLNQNEKMERFVAQINRTAEKSVQKIEKQTEKLSSTALTSFREEAAKELETQKEYASARLERESNHLLAEKEAVYKRKAAEYREQIVARVYEEAEQHLRAFLNTPAYRTLLQNCIHSLAQSMSTSRITVFVRPEDKSAAEEICKNLPNVSAVCSSDRVRIGLAFAENEDGSLHLEDTFESRLAADRARFLSACKLSIML